MNWRPGWRLREQIRALQLPPGVGSESCRTFQARPCRTRTRPKRCGGSQDGQCRYAQHAVRSRSWDSLELEGVLVGDGLSVVRRCEGQDTTEAVGSMVNVIVGDRRDVDQPVERGVNG
jgi:hypothetical protein